MKAILAAFWTTLVLGGIPVALGFEDVFTSIDYPGASSTGVTDINDTGDMVGIYTGADGLTHGFLLSGGKFTGIDVPGARLTSPNGINANGDIVGHYNDGQRAYGFLLRGGKFTPLDCAPSRSAAAYKINSAGDIAGYVYPAQAGAPSVGAVWRGGVCTTSEYRPEEARRTMTMYFGLNDSGVAVGHWATNGGSSHGIVYSKGNFTQTDHGAGGNLFNWGINNSGVIAGKFSDGANTNNGFVLREGRFTAFKFPESRGTQAFGINNAGKVVGQYTDQAGKVHGYVAAITPAGPPPPVIMVDDDGVDCSGGVRTIQEAVSRAVPGATILVCRGTYLGTVNIAGPEKTGVRLVAAAGEDEVVLQGDYTQRDGFHLENVSNVLIRGFTVRDFGVTGTTASVWGVGNQIYLENAHYNTIEHNRLINGDMMGVMLVDSGNNMVQNNVAFVNNTSLATCGIHVEGAKSAENVIRLNMTYGNKVAGIMMRGAGAGNRIADNTVISNGRFGIDVQNTDEVRIEGNRVSYNRGFWGTTPGGQQPGTGINLMNVNKAVVFDNRARNNTGADLNWDGKGENRIESNACESSTPAGACTGLPKP